MKNIRESIENLIEYSLEKNPVEFKKVFDLVIKEKAKFQISNLKELLRKNIFETEVKIIVKDGKAETEDNALHASIHKNDTTGQEDEHDNSIHASIHPNDKTGQ